jgi:hypothetical protein
MLITVSFQGETNMFEFLGIGRTSQTKGEEPKPKVTVEPVGTQPRSVDKRREMIRLALSGILRRNGISPHLIGCEVSPLVRPGSPDAVLTQLVVLKWHDGLMRYAPELQNELVKEIHLFEQTAVDSSLIIVWKFAPDCGYPHGKLPAPAFWSPLATPTEAMPVVAEKLTTVATVQAATAAKFDLPKSKFDDDDDRDNGFAATQIGNHL